VVRDFVLYTLTLWESIFFNFVPNSEGDNLHHLHMEDLIGFSDKSYYGEELKLFVDLYCQRGMRAYDILQGLTDC